MARALIVLPLLLTAACGAPSPVDLDARGVARVTVGGVVVLEDLGVTLVAPGWNGAKGDQRDLRPADVTRAGDSYSATLVGGGVRTHFKLTASVRPGGMRLEYELTPEQDTAVETVLLGGRLPTDAYAGLRRWLIVDDGVTGGAFPKDLDAEHYIFADRPAPRFVGLLGGDGPALRVNLEGLDVALQDDRKWQVSAFALHLMPIGAAGALKGGVPVRFAVELLADTSAHIEAAARAATSVGPTALTSRAALAVGPTAVDHATPAVYQSVDLSPTVTATFDNPFDPADVSVAAEVTAPDGKTFTQPAFYSAPYTSSLQGNRERLAAAGAPSWRVRLTPTMAGQWRVAMVAKDRSGTARGGEVTLQAAAGTESGFVRVSPDSPHYFRTDDGKSYFLVGENMGWPSARGTFDYADWLPALGRAGGNWVRVWMSTWNCGLEWSADARGTNSTGGYGGLGVYNLGNAWKLDRILATARAAGVRVMVCFGTYGEWTDGGFFNEGQWKANPYNVANGGPCQTKEEFFTNPKARAMYQRRLSYILARWGSDPTVFGWEFWNEWQAPASWVGEMAAYVKAHDPYHHPVSNTYGDDAVWKLPDVDFTMIHDYGDSGNRADFTDAFAAAARQQWKYNKPFFPAEFGIDWRTGDNKYDPKGSGYNLHNGLWSAALSGSAGGAMIWYWDGYVHPLKLYPAFNSLARFVQQVDWAHQRFAPLDGVRVEQAAGSHETFTDLTVPATAGWGKSGGAEYTLGQDGSVTGQPIASTLGSPKRGGDGKELHSTLTFHLDMPAAGRFTAHLGTVSDHARLQIAVDGKIGVDEPLATGAAGAGPWKTAVYQTQWKMWNCDYDKDYAVDVPAGAHTVTVGNAEGDWLIVSSYRITGYRSSRFPDVRVVGVGATGERLAWIHDERSTWVAARDGVTLTPREGLRVTLPAAEGGTWTVSWWDTWAGRELRADTVTAAGGALTLSAPTFTRDVACRAVRAQ
jgi:hypothetical protein